MVPPREPSGLIHAVSVNMIVEAERGDVAGIDESAAVEGDRRCHGAGREAALAIAKSEPHDITFDGEPSDEMLARGPVDRGALADRCLPVSLGRGNLRFTVLKPSRDDGHSLPNRIEPCLLFASRVP